MQKNKNVSVTHSLTSSMKFSFEAKIYKVGINPCVKVPLSITGKMKPVKGFIQVRGKINNHAFRQTLVPVKDEEYRLYVNGPMLKGSHLTTGDTAQFIIRQDESLRKKKDFPMLGEFKKELSKDKLENIFEGLTASRKKDILKYLNSLKTKEALQRNIEKVILQLKNKKAEPGKNKNIRIP
jgi:hypothetical protein